MNANTLLLGGGAVNNFIHDSINFDFCIDGFLDLENYYYESLSSPIISSSQKEGVSKYWHGVIPLDGYNFFNIDKSFYIQRLNRFYTISNNYFDQNFIFVPRFKIKNTIKNKVFDHILNLEYKNNSFIINSFYQNYSARKIYMGLGAYKSSRLYNALTGIKNDLGKDQVCGYLGNINTSNLIKYISKSNILLSAGYLLPYYIHPLGDYILTFRPANFDFNNVDNTYKFRTAFNSGTRDIIKRLNKFKSPGLIMEAIYNKYGFSFYSNTFNIYFQSSKSADVLMGKKFILNNDQAYSIATDIFADSVNKMPEIKLAKLNFTPALHLHSTINNQLPIDNLFITDSSVLPTLGPYHHTFLTSTNFLFHHD